MDQSCIIDILAFAPARLHSISSGLLRNLVERGGTVMKRRTWPCTASLVIKQFSTKDIELGGDDLREFIWNTLEPNHRKNNGWREVHFASNVIIS